MADPLQKTSDSSTSSSSVAPESTALEVCRTAGAALIVVAFCGVLLIHNPQWFWADDFQSYQLANYRDMARSWRAGEFPLLSPYSWQSGALAGEYQNGVFSIAITGLVLVVFALDLSLTNAASALVLVHLAILAMGTFRLGRRRGLSCDLAMMVALATSLSGSNIIWGAKTWLPALASFAWLPWFWWALDRAIDDQGNVKKVFIAGIFLYLIISAGWPFTVLMAMLLSGWLLRRHRVGYLSEVPRVLMAMLLSGWSIIRGQAQQSRWRPSWPVIGAWLIGLGLSAPAWMMLLEYTSETVRGQTPANVWTVTWVVPLSSLPGLVFPAHSTDWNVFGFDKPHMSAELAGGLVPLAALFAACVSAGRTTLRKFGWEFGLCLLVLVLAVIPTPGKFRESFRWLPMFALVLSLIGGHCLAQWRASGHGGRWTPSLWACILVSGAWLLAGNPTRHALMHGSALLGLCVIWAIIDRRCALGSTLRIWMPSVVVLGSCWLTFGFVDSYLEVPAWPEAVAERPRELDPKVRYLSLYDWHDVFQDVDRADHHSSTWALTARETFLWTGNFSLYSGVEFINGYSPMHPIGLTTLFAFRAQGYCYENVDAALQFVAAEAGPKGLLDLMGVDGLIVSARYRHLLPILQAKDWRLDVSFPDCFVLHRQTSSRAAARSLNVAVGTSCWDRAIERIRDRQRSNAGWVLFNRQPVNEPSDRAPAQEFAQAEVALRRECRNSVTVAVMNSDAQREALIAFSRPWYPGYRARFNGRTIAVERLNLIMPAVRLPAGESGELVLEYRPNSLIRGTFLAFITFAMAIVVSIVARRRGRPVGLGGGEATLTPTP